MKLDEGSMRVRFGNIRRNCLSAYLCVAVFYLHLRFAPARQDHVRLRAILGSRHGS